jgi:hypothetical protein
MAYNKPRYDAACHYSGKPVGRCTVSDSKAYVAMMEQCGNSAARVLREYAYFSSELKAILEKVAAIQAVQNRAMQERPASLFKQPESSPWGEVQHCETLCPGVFMVDTASHGGIMVSKDVSAMLSPAARKCGFKQGGYLASRKIAKRMLPCGSFWTKNCGPSLTVSGTRRRLRKISTSPYGNITQITGGRGKAGFQTHRPVKLRPFRLTAPSANHFGPSWPEVERRILDLWHT